MKVTDGSSPELAAVAAFLDNTHDAPSDAYVAGLRERLAAAQSTTVVPLKPSRASRRVPVSAWAAVGLAAAITIATGVVVSRLGSSPGGTPLAVGTRTTRVLLAAASAAERSPATGKYWRVEWMNLRPVLVGPKAHPYRMDRRDIEETWDSRDGGHWTGERVAGAAPSSAADAEAWHADGSPQHWPQAAEVLNTAAEPGSFGKEDEGAPWLIGNQGMTLRQVQALPTDPAKLAAKVGRDTRDVGNVGQALAGMLAATPLTPKARAAAYRALATLPGARVDGAATDELGRHGTQVTIPPEVCSGKEDTAPPGHCLFPQTVLIIDPATSQVLSQSTGTTKADRTLIVASGWTDAPPRAPLLP